MAGRPNGGRSANSVPVVFMFELVYLKLQKALYITRESCKAMVIHLKDAEVDSMVRALAKKRGMGITAVIKQAVGRELGREEKKTSLWERTADLRAHLNSFPATGEKVDKRFYDELWGQEDE